MARAERGDLRRRIKGAAEGIEPPGSHSGAVGGRRPSGEARLEAGIAGLIGRHRGLTRAEREGMTEMETGARFVLPLLRALGWGAEDSGEVRGLRGAARGLFGYELLLGGMPKIAVVVKAMSAGLDGRCSHGGGEAAFPEQAVRYAWNRGADWALLTNFEESRLYHALSASPEDGLALSAHAAAAGAGGGPGGLAPLSRESVAAGRLGAAGLRAGRRAAGEQIIDDLEDMRRLLHEDMRGRNGGIGGGGELRAAAQALLARLLVVRAAEDRGLAAAGALRREADAWRRGGRGAPLARRLGALFADFGGAHGSALLKEGAVDGAPVSSGLLAGIVDRLYAYDFALIDSDVIGGAYEGYLAAHRGDGGGGRRKSLGAYYTPPLLVSHALEATLGARLAECRTPGDVAQIRVLDPSCGTGSFLIGAFDLIMGWYDAYNRSASGGAAAGGAQGGGHAAVADPGTRIVRDNLFGIDIDPRAAGIASMNLTLRAAAGGGGLDRLLGATILVGNPLLTGREEGLGGLGPAELEALRPLDPARLPHARFDVVVGNPPYCSVGRGSPLRASASYEAVRSGGPVNAAMMFVERAAGLLRADGGRLGMVVPKACAYAKGWSGTRRVLLSGQIRLTHVADCSEAFRGVSLEQIIVAGRRRGAGAPGGGACRVQRVARGAARGGGEVSLSALADNDAIFLESDPASWSIREKMLAGGVALEGLLGGGAITAGEYAQGLGCWQASRPEGGLRMLAGGDIARYRIAASRYYRRDEPLMAARRGGGAGAAAPQVVGQRIVAHLGSPRPHIVLAFAYDEEGSRAFDTVARVAPGGRIDAHALVAVLNSRPVSWYAHRFVFCNAVRSMDLRPWYLGRIVVPLVGAADEKELAGLGKKAALLAQSRHARRPGIKGYLQGGGRGTLELRDYIGAAGAGGAVVHGKGAAGAVGRVDVVDAGGGWLDFFADYAPQPAGAPRRGRALSLRVPDRGVRDFVRVFARRGLGGGRRAGRGGRAEPVHEQIARIRLPAYGGGFDGNLRALRAMLAPYARDAERFDAWREEFARTDARIDAVVCRAFGLSRGDALRINASSRPPEWSNY